ncbi:MAG: hypothetical protein RL420_1014 [Pseudomonadota bacterium]|jgi:catechol 2,3-dioxygenase-like lactoylglutathione lyase family enzyme
MNRLPEFKNLSLDHVGLIVPDLNDAYHLWKALGFQLTSRADHTRIDAEGHRIPAGSSQHSVMLEQGYIELMQITDLVAGHPLSPAMKQRYGLHILAIATLDSHATHKALSQLGCPVSAVMDWCRPVKEGNFEGLAKFSFFDTPWHSSDAAYVCWVQHLTPECIRRPGATNHDNGAVGLTAVFFEGVGADCIEWTQRLISMGLVPAVNNAMRSEIHGVEFTIGSSRLLIRKNSNSERLLPSAIQIEVKDVDVFHKRAQACQLDIQSQGAGIEINLGSVSPIRLQVTQIVRL